MTRTCDCTTATATGDTVETTIGTITLPPSARKIVGIGCYAMGAATLTSGEPVTGIFRVAVSGKDVTPAKFPLDIIDILTSGAIALNPRIFEVDWENVANSIVEFFVTMDVAQSGGLKARGYVIFDKDVR